MSGRGLYVCPKASCIEKLKRNRIIPMGAPESRTIYDALVAAVPSPGKETADALLGFAARSRKIVMGSTAVEAAIKKGKTTLVVLDGGVAPNTHKRMSSLADRHNVPIVLKNRGKPLESLVGKPNCRCLGIVDAHFAHAILDAMKTNETGA